MSDINGAHWPDGQMYHLEQCLRAASGSVTCLDFQLKNSDLTSFGHNGIMYADKENCNTYGVLRNGRASQGIPPSDRIIHIRQFVPDWRIAALNMNATDPAQWTVNESGVRRWADHVVDRLSHWQGTEEHHQMHADIFMDSRVAISPDNEQDIEPVWVNYMQTKHWYDLIGRIALVWLDQINRRRPDRKCLTMTPPLAGGHEPWGDSPDSEYTLPAMRDMLQAFDVIGGHCYGLLNQAPTRGMFGSEARWYGLRLWRGMTELSTADTNLALKNAEDPGGLVYQARELGKLVHVSECGTFRHDDKGYVDENFRHMAKQLDIASRSGLVTGMDWFIWNSNSAHSGNRIWYSEGLRAKLEHAPRFKAAEWPAVDAQPIPPDPVKPPIPPEGELHPANPHNLAVGEGVLNLMQLHTDRAVTDEIYFNGPSPSVMSLTVGASGYLYVASQNAAEGIWRTNRHPVEYTIRSGGGGGVGVIDKSDLRQGLPPDEREPNEPRSTTPDTRGPDELLSDNLASGRDAAPPRSRRKPRGK